MVPFNTPSIDRLFAAILQLQDGEECHKFSENRPIFIAIAAVAFFAIVADNAKK